MTTINLNQALDIADARGEAFHDWISTRAGVQTNFAAVVENELYEETELHANVAGFDPGLARALLRRQLANTAW